MSAAFSIISFGADGFAECLKSAIDIPGPEVNTAVTVVVTDSYLNPELRAWNRKAVEGGDVWIPVRGSWVQPWVGPVFSAGGPCYECLRSRLSKNAHVDAFIAQSVPAYPQLCRREARCPALMDAAAKFVSMQLDRQLNRSLESRHPRTIAQLDLLTHACSSHVVVKRPQCPVCGMVGEEEPGPIVLQDHRYTYKEGGERRAVRPMETWRRYRHCISPISGVVSSFVSKTDPADTILHSYAAGHAFPVMAGDLVELRGNMRHRSGGKGVTALHAKVGALCEAIERYSGLWQDTEPVVNGSYRALSPDAIAINEILLLSDRQYAERGKWNKGCATNFQIVPEPFDPDLEVAWVRVWSLGERRFRLVPAAYCYYGQRDLRYFFCACDSNGNAAGNTLEEAIMRGFMELVERDAVAIWWYNRLRMPALDIASFKDPYLEGLLNYYAALGRELWALDLTSDLGIPVVGVVSRCVDHKSEDIVIGFSADMDIKTALLRAVNEVGQFMPALSERDEQGNTRYFYDDECAKKWWRTARVAMESYLLPAEGVAHGLSDFTPWADSNQRIEVETCVRLAAACDIDILVLNQTRPDIGLPVVKVIAPGMRHFWNRLGPGRLYEVPVRQGYLDAPKQESELNPVPMFF
ncbi:MAG: TOMM precursor leader peptide-binding protein [Deltaproteobacteria bacterium]|nr:TOMM precursor leader peptide-binding protein [Deltaproteobacteria bacterium]